MSFPIFKHQDPHLHLAQGQVDPPLHFQPPTNSLSKLSRDLKKFRNKSHSRKNYLIKSELSSYSELSYEVRPNFPWPSYQLLRVRL